MLKRGRTKTTETERCEAQDRRFSPQRGRREPEPDKDAWASDPLSH